MHVLTQVRTTFTDWLIERLPVVRGQVWNRRRDAALEAAITLKAFPICVLSVTEARITTERSGSGKHTQERAISVAVTIIRDVPHDTDDTEVEADAVLVEKALADWQDLPLKLRDFQLESGATIDLAESETGVLKGHRLTYTATVVTDEGVPDTSIFRS